MAIYGTFSFGCGYVLDIKDSRVATDLKNLEKWWNLTTGQEIIMHDDMNSFEKHNCDNVLLLWVSVVQIVFISEVLSVLAQFLPLQDSEMHCRQQSYETKSPMTNMFDLLFWTVCCFGDLWSLLSSFYAMDNGQVLVGLDIYHKWFLRPGRFKDFHLFCWKYIYKHGITIPYFYCFCKTLILQQ